MGKNGQATERHKPALHVSKDIAGQLVIHQQLAALFAFVAVLQGHSKAARAGLSPVCAMWCGIRPGGTQAAVIVVAQAHLRMVV